MGPVVYAGKVNRDFGADHGREMMGRSAGQASAAAVDHVPVRFLSFPRRTLRQPGREGWGWSYGVEDVGFKKLWQTSHKMRHCEDGLWQPESSPRGLVLNVK